MAMFFNFAAKSPPHLEKIKVAAEGDVLVIA